VITMKPGGTAHVSDLLGLSEGEFTSLTHSLMERLRAKDCDWECLWKHVRGKKGKDHDAAIFIVTMFMVTTGSVYPDKERLQ